MSAVPKPKYSELPRALLTNKKVHMHPSVYGTRQPERVAELRLFITVSLSASSRSPGALVAQVAQQLSAQLVDSVHDADMVAVDDTRTVLDATLLASPAILVRYEFFEVMFLSKTLPDIKRYLLDR